MFSSFGFDFLAGFCPGYSQNNLNEASEVHIPSASPRNFFLQNHCRKDVNNIYIPKQKEAILYEKNKLRKAYIGDPLSAAKEKVVLMAGETDAGKQPL